MALLLAITAVISCAAGYIAYRLGWLTLSPTIRWTLLAGYALSSVLTFFNVWFSANRMFVSQHDLYLSVVLLLFSGGMAMVLGYFLSNTVTNRIHDLKDVAGKLAQGELGARAKVGGRDEVSDLADSFNRMAAQLQAVDQKQREIEHLRADLIAWVGHDLQTPLASIRAILEALADGVVEEPQAVQRYLLTAQRDVRSLSALIDDLFEMAQLDAGELPLNREESSLTDLISDTLESFSELASRQGIAISGRAEPSIDPVFMDTLQIGRVLNNLLTNALRHTPAGGEIAVAAQRTGHGVEVAVRDTGEGIQPNDLPKVFESFYRGEKSRSRLTGGSGLGLAISRGIVRAHGGDITVQSTPGGGSTFTFTLP
jgi:signal transduction histidine kinase